MTAIVPDIASQYDASFKGIAFWEQYSGLRSANGGDITDEDALIHIPGGNTTVLQSFGRLARTFDLPIVAELDEYASLAASVGTSGTLIYHGGSVSARLRTITSQQKIARRNAFSMSLRFTLL